MIYDQLIVGAGIFGAVAARELASQGARVLVIDSRGTIGGNIYTERRLGIDVHRYGAHIFHTSDEEVWSYVSRFARFNGYINSPVAIWRDELYNLPFNMNTFNRLWGVTRPDEARAIIRAQAAAEVRRIIRERGETPSDDDEEVLAGFVPADLEEQGLCLAGRDIFDKLVRGYTEKQWGRDCKELPAFIIRRLPFRYIYDNNYFDDRYQGIPEDGYTAMVERLLDVPGMIEVRLSTPYEELCERDETGLPVRDADGYRVGPDHARGILFTGMIDAFFGYRFGELSYRSLRFETEELPDIDNYQGNAVVNYTERKVPYTRIIEHKHFTFGKGSGTVITHEYPATWRRGDEPYYPVNDEANTALYERYRDYARTLPGISFGGRLGQYRYYNMDQTVAAALKWARERA